VALTIADSAELSAMRRAGRVAAATLAEVGRRLRPGVSTGQIDRWVRADTRSRGATPSQLGYHGFPAAVCTSRNDVVCHGIPSDHEIIVAGDIVNVDVTSCLDGFHGDTSVTFLVGAVAPEARRVVEVAQACLQAGIDAVAPGQRLGDVGAAIERTARAAGCHLVVEFGGHGIGRRMHMPPHVSHVGRPNTGLRLRPGMIFTIEPMVTLTAPRLVHADDGWRVSTHDARPSAQFEHTVAVTAAGAEILTVPPAPIVLQVDATPAPEGAEGWR
jgi:methionyl aminopeptidase